MLLPEREENARRGGCNKFPPRSSKGFLGTDDNRSAHRSAPAQKQGKLRGAPRDPTALFLRRKDGDRPKTE
jgi:hypothetical protein